MGLAVDEAGAEGGVTPLADTLCIHLKHRPDRRGNLTLPFCSEVGGSGGID